MNATIYDPATGRIISNFSTADESVFKINLVGKTWIPGDWSSRYYRVVNGKAVEKAPQPNDQGYLVYDYDTVTDTWSINQIKSAATARSKRNQLLSAVDKVNPLWYASLTTEQQNELVTYRSALLAVPQQVSFPAVIEWPAKPHWL